MAPVTPVFMRVLRPRCYRTSHAVYGIATEIDDFAWSISSAVTGPVMPFTALQLTCTLFCNITCHVMLQD